jgi:DNA-binding NarL/FixJ family response regulator
VPEETEEFADERPVVHVLVSEAFFRNRVVDTLNALVLNPVVADLETDAAALAETVASVPAQGVVLDLEEEGGDVLSLLGLLRDDPRTADWLWLCYCSHESEELVAEAARHGLEAVPRSTFASSLVRMLQGFEPKAEG